MEQKMFNIYEVTNDFLGKIELLQKMDDLPSDALEDTLGALSNEMAQDLGAYCKNIEAELTAMQNYEIEMRKKEDNMREKRVRLKNKLDKFKEYLLTKFNESGIKSLECSEFTIYVKNNPSAVAVQCEVEKLPQEYIKIRTIVSPNKLKLKNAIKDGAIIDGVELVTTKRIEIK
jgi:Siphovirus Gp157.